MLASTQGAIVTEFQTYIYDNHGTYDIDIQEYLYRRCVTDNYGTALAWITASTTGSSTNIQVFNEALGKGSAERDHPGGPETLDPGQYHIKNHQAVLIPCFDPALVLFHDHIRDGHSKSLSHAGIINGIKGIINLHQLFLRYGRTIIGDGDTAYFLVFLS